MNIFKTILSCASIGWWEWIMISSFDAWHLSLTPMLIESLFCTLCLPPNRTNKCEVAPSRWEKKKISGFPKRKVPLSHKNVSLDQKKHFFETPNTGNLWFRQSFYYQNVTAFCTFLFWIFFIKMMTPFNNRCSLMSNRFFSLMPC